MDRVDAAKIETERGHVMGTVYLICAAVGGTLLVCQFLLSLVGFGDHHDFGGHDVHIEHAGGSDHDHHHGGGGASSWFIRLLTFRAIVAAMTVFGLAGLAAVKANWPAPQSLAVALVGGFGAMMLVALLMRGLHSLQAEGTVQIASAIGKAGTVYLTIPGDKAGFGKVQLNLQNRTAEYQAVTFQGELPTGTKIVVVDVIGSDTVEVVAAPESARLSHA